VLGQSAIAFLELNREAINRANKRVLFPLSYSAVVVLVVVYRAENRSQRILANNVADRMRLTHNHYTDTATFEQLRRLVEKGYLDKKKEGRRAYYSCSVQGRNYVGMIAKTLISLKSKF
jgi:DNA-binding transcriptional ArsR family regulator